MGVGVRVYGLCVCVCACVRACMFVCVKSLEHSLDFYKLKQITAETNRSRNKE